jgi:hypothetical protein
MEWRSEFRVLAAACVALAAAAPGARAAVVTVSELAAPADVTTTHEVILTGPPPFKTFIDRLSVRAAPVTLSGGDTLNFHLALEPPTRFAISTTANLFSVGVELRSSASGTPAARSGDPPTVVLLAPDHPPPFGPAFTTYFADPGTGKVTSFTAIQQYGSQPPAPAAAFDPVAITFSGFDGTVAVPVDFPTTTFDLGASLFVIGELDRGVDPPGTLAYLTTVPEPAGVPAACALGIGMVGAGLGRRRGRSPAAGLIPRAPQRVG